MLNKEQFEQLQKEVLQSSNPDNLSLFGVHDKPFNLKNVKSVKLDTTKHMNKLVDKIFNGRFLLQQPLNRGCFGIVYVGIDINNNQQIVIKVVSILVSVDLDLTIE